MNLSPTKWNNAYREAKTPWRGEGNLSLYLGKVPKVGLALDLGCGTGEKSQELVEMGYWVTGFDFSSEALREARLGFTQPNFVQMDLNHLPAWKDNFTVMVDWKAYVFVENKEEYVDWVYAHTQYFLVHLYVRNLEKPQLEVSKKDLDLLSKFTEVEMWRTGQRSEYKEAVTMLLKK